MTRRILTGVLVVALALATGLPAFAESESDGGYFDYFADGGKIGNRFVSWIWAPHYFPGGIDYSIFLLCERYDANGFGVGNNKVTIKNIAFFGLDSEILLEFKKASRKLGKFRKDGYLILNTPDLEILADDSFVAAEVQFQIKGSSDDDQIKCSADVTESPLIGAESAVREKSAPSRSLVEILRDRPSTE